MSDNYKGLDFHQTFKPERSCLSSLMMNLPERSGKNVQEISKLTGIPTGSSSGKVAPTISYLEFGGLIKEKLVNRKYELTLTKLGETVLSEDPGLMENLTLLLFHCMLTRRNNGADLWSFIVCDVLGRYHGKITKANLSKELELHFGKTLNMAPFNGTYSGFLDQIGVLKISENDYVLHTQTFNSEFIYLYGLILYEYWADWMKGFTEEEIEKLNISSSEITAPQILETGFRYPFGWSEHEEYQVLEALHDRGIVSLNRQMTPFAVRKLYTKEQMIDMLYSELC